MPAKRSLTLALALLLVAAIPVRGATPPTLHQIDLRPGVDSSGPGDLISFKDRVYFVANDGSHGQELWRTDGAADASHTGTELVCDLFTAPGYGSNPYNLTVFGDWLYFMADAGVARYALFRTNGAIDGCELVDPSITGDFSFESPRVVGDQLWFGGRNASDDVELWMTTSTGTPVQVLNINPTSSSYPSEFTQLGSNVYFRAYTDQEGVELWKSSGTGATMVADINGAPGQGSNPSNLVAIGDTLYFSGNTESDGVELMHASASGYDGYFDINDGLWNSQPNNLTNFKGQLYFAASTLEFGSELWRVTSDGSDVERLTDINPGTGSSGPDYLTPIGDWIYFRAYNSSFGYELWRSNGTTTELVIDILPGADSGYPFGFVERDGVIFFQASTGPTWTIFQTTGTAESTVEAVTGTGTNPYIGCECDSPVVFAGDRAFTYSSNDEYGFEVAFFDPLLPSTNRDGTGLSTALIIGAALTAAAGLTLRMRAAKQQ
jgi:ELWxxDGT repeat protein